MLNNTNNTNNTNARRNRRNHTANRNRNDQAIRLDYDRIALAAMLVGEVSAVNNIEDMAAYCRANRGALYWLKEELGGYAEDIIEGVKSYRLMAEYGYSSDCKRVENNVKEVFWFNLVYEMRNILDYTLYGRACSCGVWEGVRIPLPIGMLIPPPPDTNPYCL